MKMDKKLSGSIQQIKYLTGALNDQNLNGELNQKIQLEGIVKNTIILKGNIDKYSGSIEPLPHYPGPFEITPLPFEETILHTKGKVVNKNIKILEIPYYKTSNESGYTVYIGGN